MTETQSDRGQLILAGAVSFALILIAIAIVFSTTLFTASMGSGGTVEAVSDGTGTEQSVENTTAELIRGVNEDVRGGKVVALRENVSTYSELLAESKAETSPTYVDVSIVDVEFGGGGEIDHADIRIVYETPSVLRKSTIEVNP